MLDDILKDIVDIFNMENVQLVRLSGLTLREKTIDINIDPITINQIINHLKERNVINYNKIVYCPHCKEIFYFLTNETGNHICDTCKSIFNINALNTLMPIQVADIINFNTMNINEKGRF